MPNFSKAFTMIHSNLLIASGPRYWLVAKLGRGLWSIRQSKLKSLKLTKLSCSHYSHETYNGDGTIQIIESLTKSILPLALYDGMRCGRKTSCDGQAKKEDILTIF